MGANSCRPMQVLSRTLLLHFLEPISVRKRQSLAGWYPPILCQFPLRGYESVPSHIGACNSPLGHRTYLLDLHFNSRSAATCELLTLSCSRCASAQSPAQQLDPVSHSWRRHRCSWGRKHHHRREDVLFPRDPVPMQAVSMRLCSRRCVQSCSCAGMMSSWKADRFNVWGECI